MPHTPTPPSRDQLRSGLTRTSVTLVLLAGAALVVRSSGHHDQLLPYLAMAAAVLPQLLLLVLALLDHRRVEKLKVSRRPVPVLALIGLVLVGSAVVSTLDHGFVWPPAWAAALAAGALLLASAPPVVAPLPVRRGRA